MKNKILFFVSLILMFAAFTVAADADEVHISAAASLTEAVKELVVAYRAMHPDVELSANFAASGALAKQITAGAPSDIFISANPKWMDYLQQQGLVDDKTRQVLVGNSLVFVALSADIDSFADVTQLGRIALASPKSAPAGRYAQQALSNAGFYPQLLAEQRLILAKDVRQALIYADRGEVDGAFVYRTDVALAKQAKALFSVPQQLYPQILYPVALTRGGTEKTAAKEFFAYLLSADAKQVFARYGFIISV